MRGLKRKRRKFGGHQKDSAFDSAAYQTEQDMATANVQYIHATIALTPKSSLKKEVKRMLKADVAKVVKLVNQNNQLLKGVDSTKRKLLLSWMDDNCKLAVALQVKRKKSCLTIAQLLDDIRQVMVENNRDTKDNRDAKG
jgi:hypothetical protein